MDGSGCMKENSKMQKREFLKGSLAALGVFGCGAAAARSEFPEARDIKWDETFDVVVVGSGIAATCAANESIDLGAKRVIMVDKMPVFGGNSAITGFWINVPRTPEQLAHGVKDDSPELFLKDTLKAGEYFNDPKLAHALCFKALESFEYIRKLGCEFAPTPFIQGGHSKIRSLAPKVSAGISVMLPLHRHFLKRGGIMRKNTIVDEIIKDETGRCVGVAVRENYVFDINSRDNDLTNKTGVRKYYRAEKGIVFGAGGFVNDWRMCSLIDPKITKETEGTNHPGATGDGLVLAEKAGAQLIDMTEIQTHPTVVPKVGEMITEAVRGNGAILINKDGKRFFNELNTRDAVSAAILKQKDGVAYLFFDSDMQKSLKATNNYIKQSYCVSGATIEEVAGKMGVPAAELQASIDAWKKGKAAGKDAFGRADMPRNLDQAPFYAIMVTPAVHHTMGGIKIDSKTQVYNTKGQVVPGLFAAGEITGGVHGGNRLGGNAQADIVTFGRIAGQQSYIYAMQAAAADKAKK